MKNILYEKPDYSLSGRLLASAQFVKDNDIKDKKILDIGCGYGWCELNLLKRGAQRIIATEIKKESLQTVKKYIKNSKASFEIADALNLPYQNNMFNTVVCWEVIEHLPKGKEHVMLAEIYRVLKAKGSLYLSTPHSAIIYKILDPAWWLIGHRHYGRDELSKMAKQQGFKIQAIKIKGGFWALIASLNMYLAKWIFRRGPFLQKTFERLETIDYARNRGFMTIYGHFIKDKS